jgi:flagellar export protein FliJ
MPPKFSLQPVLNYRHTRVEGFEVELGVLLDARQRGSEFLEKLRSFQKGLFAEMHTQQSGGLMDLEKVAQLRSNLKLIEERIHVQIETLAELDSQVEAKRNELVAAKQDEETLVKLKENELDRYREQQARQESRLQDDIYIAQAFHKGAGN